MSGPGTKRHIVVMGVKCCFGIDGHRCKDCPYNKQEAIEEMTCDQDLARDVLSLIGGRDAERSDQTGE